MLRTICAFMMTFCILGCSRSENQRKTFVEKVFPPCMVDYTCSLKEAIKAGCYDEVDEEITENNFPLQKDEQGKRQVVFKIFYFKQSVESEDAVKMMRMEGCRLATLLELLSFGKDNPEIQTEFVVVALKSYLQSNAARRITLLNSTTTKRVVCSRWFRNEWASTVRFLAVAD